MSFVVRTPSACHLEMFKKNLWKEQRKLEIVRDEYATLALRKYFVTSEAGKLESCYLNIVKKFVGSNSTPEVLNVTDCYIDLEYIKGARLHTVFMILKELEKESYIAHTLRKKILYKTIASSKSIQLAMIEAKNICNKSFHIYPFKDKIISLLDLFNNCLLLNLNMSEIYKEVKSANDYMKNIDCLVPFRDAAPKNFILECPDIWRGNITSSEQYGVVRSFLNTYGDDDSSPLLTSNIINIDFASCNELTVPEDDPISLLFQESAWLGSIKSNKELLWNTNELDKYQLAIGLVIRLYRFGGRRLSYKLVHSKGFQKRYGDESISYYFDTLIQLSENICPSIKLYFPLILDATYRIQNRLKDKMDIEKDWFLDKYKPSLDKYYNDIYPY